MLLRQTIVDMQQSESVLDSDLLQLTSLTHPLVVCIVVGRHKRWRSRRNVPISLLHASSQHSDVVCVHQLQIGIYDPAGKVADRFVCMTFAVWFAVW